MSKYKLYHYSKELYKDLRTLDAQNAPQIPTRIPVNKPHDLGSYREHISFFFDPIPADIMGSIFKKDDNDIWKTGNKLYEYTIDVNSLPEFKYNIVESPLKIRLFYSPELDHLSGEDWLDYLYKEKLKINEVGYHKGEFLRVLPRYQNVTRKHYLKVMNYPNWDRVKDKYAANVPHVKLYPKGGIIKYESHRKITIGNNPIPQIAKEALILQW